MPMPNSDGIKSTVCDAVIFMTFEGRDFFAQLKLVSS